METVLKAFTIFWLTGRAEIIKGHSVGNAMSKAGYGAGTIRVIDFYAEGDIRGDYTWDGNKRTWNKKIMEKV